MKIAHLLIGALSTTALSACEVPQTEWEKRVGFAKACHPRAADCGESFVQLTNGEWYVLLNASRRGEPQRSRYAHHASISHVLAKSVRGNEKLVINLSESLDHIKEVRIRS